MKKTIFKNIAMVMLLGYLSSVAHSSLQIDEESSSSSNIVSTSLTSMINQPAAQETTFIVNTEQNNMLLAASFSSAPAVTATSDVQEDIIQQPLKHHREQIQALILPISTSKNAFSSKLIHVISPKLDNNLPVELNKIILSFFTIQDIQSTFREINLHLYDEYDLEIFDDLIDKFMGSIIREEKPETVLVEFLRRIVPLETGQSVFRRMLSRKNFTPLEYSPDQVCAIQEAFPTEWVKIIPCEKLPSIVRRFLSGKLVYRPDPNSDDGMIEFSIATLDNPLEGAFDLSDCGNTNNHLSILTGYPKFKKKVTNKFYIWLCPWFLFKNNFRKAPQFMDNKKIMEWTEYWAPVGIFWTGSYENYYDFLTNAGMNTISCRNLYENYKKSTNSEDLHPTSSESEFEWRHATPKYWNNHYLANAMRSFQVSFVEKK